MVRNEADGPARETNDDEIEVTPEMIDAGAEEITYFFLGLAEGDKVTEREAVKAIYLRMEAARRKSSHEASLRGSHTP